MRLLLRTALTPLVILALFLELFGVCGCGASARERTLRAGLVSLNVAGDTLLAVSKEREQQIVERATTKEEGRAELDAWRGKVDKVAAALELGYRAIYAASILDDAKSLEDAASAVAVAIGAVAALKPKPSPEPSPPPPTPPKETP